MVTDLIPLAWTALLLEVDGDRFDTVGLDSFSIKPKQ